MAAATCDAVQMLGGTCKFSVSASSLSKQSAFKRVLASVSDSVPTEKRYSRAHGRLHSATAQRIRAKRRDRRPDMDACSMSMFFSNSHCLFSIFSLFFSKLTVRVVDTSR